MKKILSFLSVLFLTTGGAVSTIACAPTKSNVNPKPPTPPAVLPYSDYVTSKIESITNNKDVVTKLNNLNDDTTGTVSYNIKFNKALSGQELTDAKNNKFWSGSYTTGEITWDYTKCSTVTNTNNQEFTVTFTYDILPDPMPVKYHFNYITFLGGTTFDIFSYSNNKCLQIPKVEAVSFVNHSSNEPWNLVIEFSVAPSQKVLDIIMPTMSKFTWQLVESNSAGSGPSPIIGYGKMVSTATDNVFELQSPFHTVIPKAPFSLEYIYKNAGIKQQVALTS